LLAARWRSVPEIARSKETGGDALCAFEDASRLRTHAAARPFRCAVAGELAVELGQQRHAIHPPSSVLKKFTPVRFPPGGPGWQPAPSLRDRRRRRRQLGRTRSPPLPLLWRRCLLRPRARLFAKRKRTLPADQFEVRAVRTRRGITMVGLFSEAITRAEREANAPYREAMAAKRLARIARAAGWRAR
jgi:hypothetical protein